MNKNEVKKGDKIVKIITGRGNETASIHIVEKVTKDSIFLEGANGNYEQDSGYAYSLTTGLAYQSVMQGLFAKIICLEAQPN